MVVEVCDGGTQHAAVVHSEDHDGALQCRISMQWRLAVRWMIAMDDHKRGLHHGPARGYQQQWWWRAVVTIEDHGLLQQMVATEALAMDGHGG